MIDSETARQVKWIHAMNPVPVQKIANLQMRMASYREELRSFSLVLGAFAVITASVVFAATYFLPDLLPLLGVDVGVIERDPHWWLTAAGVWIVMLIPPFLMMKPKRPTQEDVLADVALRRQVGMDDAVAE